MSSDIYFEDIWNLVYNVLQFEDDDYGLLPDDIAAAERKLSIHLPAALSSFYYQFGRLTQLTNSHSRILQPDELWVSQHDTIVFCEEQQKVVCWTFNKEDVPRKDSSVFQQNAHEALGEYSFSLTAFLTGVGCWNAVWCLPSIATTKFSRELLSHLNESFTAAQCMDDGPKGKDLLSFYSDELVVCAFPNQDIIYVSAQSDKTLKNFQKDASVSLSWL